MGIDGSNFVISEGGLKEPLQVADEGGNVHKLLEPQEWWHVVWFEMPLLNVVEDHVAYPNAIVVCAFLSRMVEWVEMHIVIMLSAKGEEGHEEFLY